MKHLAATIWLVSLGAIFSGLPACGPHLRPKKTSKTGAPAATASAPSPARPDTVRADSPASAGSRAMEKFFRAASMEAAEAGVPLTKSLKVNGEPLTPKAIEEYKALSVKAMSIGKFREAVDALDVAMAGSPIDRLLYELRAHALDQLDESTKAGDDRRVSEEIKAFEERMRASELARLQESFDSFPVIEPVSGPVDESLIEAALKRIPASRAALVFRGSEYRGIRFRTPAGSAALTFYFAHGKGLSGDGLIPRSGAEQIFDTKAVALDREVVLAEWQEGGQKRRLKGKVRRQAIGKGRLRADSEYAIFFCCEKKEPVELWFAVALEAD